jgi:type IV pilus assembly protein PilB
MPLSASTTSPQRSAAAPVRVGDVLLERGVIDQAQLDQALQHQNRQGHKKLIGEVLIELGFVTEEQVMATLAETYGVPFARISAKLVDPNVVELLPRDFLEKQCVLPLFVVENKLTLAVAEPTNVFLIEEVERLTGYSVQVVAATRRDIEGTLEAYVPNANLFVIDEIVDELDEEELSLVEGDGTDVTDLENSASESPVIKLVDYLIYQAVKENASDIHIEPGDGELRTRYRVDGQLFTKMQPPYRLLPAIVSRIKIMAGMDISERRLPQDGGMAVLVEKRQIDLRVSTMPGRFGEKVVIRIIDTRNATTRLERLGFSYEMLEKFRSLVHQPNGVVLVTGPTGSGKTTTLYATLNEINDDSINISTVEDPVEYHLAGVNQFQINEKAGFTFAYALRSLLRQDPDVVMVGEVRDQETARIATQAALTGHRVLSTLHTNDAPGAVTRLFDMGVEPYLIAASIRGVLAQRLVRKICSHCKESMDAGAQMQRMLRQIVASDEEAIDTVYYGTGCGKCRYTGYAGRTGIYELYIPDEKALEAVSHGASLQELRRMALDSDQYITLKRDGVEKIRAGVTTVDEVFRAVIS